MNTFEGNLVAENIKIGIVVARFNEFITSKLLAGALDNLKRENVDEKDIEVAWVPGAFEIPMIASKMVKSKKYDAIICLGAVIRGSTSHYDYVCSEVSKGIAQISLNTETKKPFSKTFQTISAISRHFMNLLPSAQQMALQDVYKRQARAPSTTFHASGYRP